MGLGKGSLGCLELFVFFFRMLREELRSSGSKFCFFCSSSSVLEDEIGGTADVVNQGRTNVHIEKPCTKITHSTRVCITVLFKSTSKMQVLL